MKQIQTGRPTRQKDASKTQVVVRLTHEERADWRRKADQAGFKTLSEMIRNFMQAV